MKTVCALIGAFFLVAGLAILIAGPPNVGPRVVPGVARASSPGGHRPLLWEADVGRSHETAPPAEAVSRSR